MFFYLIFCFESFMKSCKYCCAGVSLGSFDCSPFFFDLPRRAVLFFPTVFSARLGSNVRTLCVRVVRSGSLSPSGSKILLLSGPLLPRSPACSLEPPLVVFCSFFPLPESRGDRISRVEESEPPPCCIFWLPSGGDGAGEWTPQTEERRRARWSLESLSISLCASTCGSKYD